MSDHKLLIEEAERRWLAGTDKTRAEVMVEVLHEALTEAVAHKQQAEAAARADQRRLVEADARLARAENIIAEMRIAFTAICQRALNAPLNEAETIRAMVKFADAALALRLDEEQKP